MQVMTQLQAQQIARAGAAKMSQQGYTFRRSACNPNVFRVIKPTGRFYFVQVAGPGTAPNCMCRFFGENAAFGTCKHLEWLGGELAAEVRWELEGHIREEWETFGKYLMMAD